MEPLPTYSGTHQRSSVQIELHRSFIRFSSEDDPKKVWEISYSDLMFENVGKNNLIIKMYHRQEKELVFFCSNKHILTDLKRLGQGQKLGNVQHKLNKIYTYYASIILLPLLLLFLFPYAIRTVDSSWIEKIIGPEKLSWLGNQYLSYMVGENKYAAESTQTMAMKRLVAELQAGDAVLSSMKVQVFVAKSSEPNAFALPGDIIVINQGFLLKAKSMEEIYGVIAHELAHLKEKHITKNLLQNAGMFSGLIFLSLTIGDAAGLSKTIFELRNLSFSRDLELEADRVGMEILLKKKISPVGLITFFEQMKGNAETEKWLSYLSTHPGFEERIEKIQKSLENDQVQFIIRDKKELEKLQKLF
jgi:Zn-dependent protease with chaperone function